MTVQFPVRIKDSIAAIKPYKQGRQAGEMAEKLSSNENPFDPLPSVLEAVRKECEFNRYTDASASRLKEKLARRHGAPVESIHVAAGSVAIIAQLLNAIAGPGDEVVYAQPSFEGYPVLVAASGAEAVAVDTDDDGCHDLGQMARVVNDATRIVVICSPNNPTGTIVTRQQFEQFYEQVPSDVLIVLDEAYAEFVTNPDALDGLRDLSVATHPNVVVLRTFSKAYGLAGLRIGYAFGHPRLMEATKSASIPLSVTGLAEAAALASMDAEPELSERIAILISNRERLKNILRETGAPITDSQANFVWLSTGSSSSALGEEFERAGLVVRVFESFGVRVTVGDSASIDAVSKVMSTFYARDKSHLNATISNMPQSDWESQALSHSMTCSRLVRGQQAVSYLGDASSEIPGKPRAVLLAGSAEDIAAGLSWAHRQGIAVVPRGAGTGVSGGASAIDNCLVISTEKMNSIVSIRPKDRLAVVQPGVVLADLDRAAREFGLMYAPDPASSETATIGGTIATNAWGLHCLKYGVTADHVAALEVAMADGSLLRTGSESRKNVAGYDLTRLIVGSEGTLGIVTEATVRLAPVPEGQSATFQVSFSSAKRAGEAVGAVMASPITPDVLELVDKTTAQIVESYKPSGLNTDAAATLIGQVTAPNVNELLSRLAESFAHSGGTDFIWTESEALLAARRVSLPALAASGLGVTSLASDAAVPPSRLGLMLEGVEQLQKKSGGMISLVAHAGDGNIHAAVRANLEDRTDTEKAKGVVEQIARMAVDLGGTVTGEHGIGSLKLRLLELAQDNVSHEIHHRIKRAFDPKGILNPMRAI